MSKSNRESGRKKESGSSSHTDGSGLDQLDAMIIKTVKADDIHINGRCYLCPTKIQVSQELSILPCAHIYHSTCLNSKSFSSNQFSHFFVFIPLTIYSDWLDGMEEYKFPMDFRTIARIQRRRKRQWGKMLPNISGTNDNTKLIFFKIKVLGPPCFNPPSSKTAFYWL